MSVKLWAYDAEKCDGDFCPNCCDICSKADVDEEHIPIWLAVEMLAKRLSTETDDEVLDV